MIGATGLIGAALAASLRSRGVAVRPVTRGQLDLAGDVSGWQPPPPEKVGVAYLCAGIGSMERCRCEPELTRRVNVENTIAVARRLIGQDCFVVFLSTNQVFDGLTPHRVAGEETRPRSEYGRQKAAVEAALIEFRDRVAVVRLTKVMGPGTPLLTRWREALKRGGKITAFTDLRFAPVPVALVVRTLELIGERKLPGVVQVSAERDVTAYDLAVRLAKKLGADETLVEPASVTSLNIPPEEAPPHTTLSTARWTGELGIAAPSPWDVLS